MQTGDITLGQRLTSSIGKKIVVALTGLFLTLFLVVHLIGNLQLLKDDGGEAFNHYSEFMGHNPLIQIISKVNFAFILGHAGWGLYLAFKNRGARKTRYAVNKPSANSRWASRNMALLGTVMLAFIAIHLVNFWWQFKFGDVPFESLTNPMTGEVTKEYKYYVVVKEGFSYLPIVLFYIFAQIAIAFHLGHGIQSAFQTLGVNNKDFAPTLKKVGFVLAYGICFLFAIIPVLMYLNITL